MKKIRNLPNELGSDELPDDINSKKEETNKGLHPLIIFTFFLFIAYYFRDVFDKLHEFYYGTISKNSFRKHYGVDAKTFNKWVEIFCSSAIDLEAYKKCKKLSNKMRHTIESILGIPSETMPIMSKIQIVEAADSSYQLLRQAILSYPNFFQIKPSVFKSLNFFPPKIANHILKEYQNIQLDNALEMEKMKEQIHEKLLSRKV